MTPLSLPLHRHFRVEWFDPNTSTWTIPADDLSDLDANRWAETYRGKYPELTWRVSEVRR
jgi:hypothetical protein